MKKRIFSVALAICLVLSLMPMSVFADPAEVIQIDVGGANVDNENYLIDDSRIILRKCYSNLNHTSAAYTTPPATGVLPLCTRLRRVRRNNPPWRSL